MKDDYAGFWDESMVCHVRAWVPVDGETLALVLSPFNAPNMSSCINMALRIKPNVKEVFVYSKDKRNFLYARHSKGNYSFESVNNDWSKYIDDSFYKFIQKIGD